MSQTQWPKNLYKLLELTSHAIADCEIRRRRMALWLAEAMPKIEQRKIIKIAGTNGKGSVCAMLQAVLSEEGKTVGVFTSPHLFVVNERIRVNQELISSAQLDELAAQAINQVTAFVNKNGETNLPSFFEALLFIAFRYFEQQQTDFIIVESGIGGYFDAVGVLPGAVSAITTIALDHTKELGESVEAIARDKAGIAATNADLVLGPEINHELRAVIAQQLQGESVNIYQADIASIKIKHSDLAGTRLIVDYPQAPIELALNLLGLHQIDNFATVAAIYHCLLKRGLVKSHDSLKGVNKAHWPGRLEFLASKERTQPNFVVDVAHNPHAFLALNHALNGLVPYSKRVVLYGASEGKNYKECIQLASELAPDLFLVSGFHKAIDRQILKSTTTSALQPCKGSFASPAIAIEALKQQYDKDTVILVIGSVYLAGLAREILAV